MIHTIKLMFPVHYDEVQDLQRRLKIKYTEINKHFEGVYPGVTMSIFNKGYGKWFLSMVIDVILLLSTPNINESDYEKIERKIKFILMDIFGHSTHFKDHVLLRIDYRFDVVIKDRDIRKLLMDLYKKTTKTYRFQRKYLGKLKNGSFVPYETTVYHSSKSVKSIVYLKEEERIAKGERIQSYEKGVVRYEVQVLEDHLYYMERKNPKVQRPRKLEFYLKEDIYKEYFRKYMSHIYHLGDFYKIDFAREKLRATSLSTNEKMKLVEFLKQISFNDMDSPLKKMSKPTLKKRLEMLKNVGINPILIPKNYKPTAPSFLKNPLSNFPW